MRVRSDDGGESCWKYVERRGLCMAYFNTCTTVYIRQMVGRP